MSAYADQILTTMEYLMDDIGKRLDNQEEVLADDIEEMTRLAFKKCAEEYGLTEGTVRDKCTRQMDINTAEFYQLVKDSIGKKDLLYKIIANAKRTDTAESITKELNHNFK
ncbi:hypothetical protein LK537_16345 [Lachnoclostridium pacaense]|uniref:hypothetical protein n=1 Tax=Enterocloster hominis (ex Hitch et al. 2024) TaxID=1917870 RepID=UPI001D1078CC|nr:hypothetical protein [Lachnoclostridium pacaense]MCC2818871.1 hypothetical protein [Lachnoclostridium pacaense]